MSQYLKWKLKREDIFRTDNLVDPTIVSRSNRNRSVQTELSIERIGSPPWFRFTFYESDNPLVRSESLEQ